MLLPAALQIRLLRQSVPSPVVSRFAYVGSNMSAKLVDRFEGELREVSTEAFRRSQATVEPTKIDVKDHRGYESPHAASAGGTGEQVVAIIETRSLIRDCLTRSLTALAKCDIRSFESTAAWAESADRFSTSVLVYCSSELDKAAELNQVEALLAEVGRVPVMVMSDSRDPDHIIALLGKGARGFVPTDTSLEVASQAMRFVAAGGVFVPASSLVEARRRPAGNDQSKPNDNELFTSRQIAVIKALRMGKANKVIAYELNMCESTVKVHVRNIMRKLKARNRTQVAFLANEMFK